jgi:thiamine-phosphate diphosphorylase
MLTLYGKDFTSRLLLGTAQYPSPESLKQAVEASGAEIVTVSLRRESARSRTGQGFWALIEELGRKVLPNTAGCRTAKEAIATAHMARELFGTGWIKLEVIANDDTLQPDLFGLVEAAAALSAEGFDVLPYTTEDLSAAERLIAAGCTVLMPWAAPIGSARGLINKDALKTLRAYFPDTPLIIDAGLGTPSHAAEAMEMGYDAVLLNTAVAKAGDPAKMAAAFARAVEAGGRHAVLQDRSRVLIGLGIGPALLELDPFYPIVPDTKWLARLLPHGIRLVQLRIKDQSDSVIRVEIDKAVALCAAHGCELVVNDYWRAAIDAGAGFVHLGQEDLAAADLSAIRAAGVRIGVSTHSFEELDRALATGPDYVALGPIYATTLKAMPFPPQGLPRLAEWRARVACPLVAIGGITLHRAPLVLAAGADSVAVITDIVTSQHPEARVENWIEATAPWRSLSTGGPQD